MFSTRICVDRLVLLSRCNFAEKLLTSFSSVKAWRKAVPKHATINNYHAPSWSKKSMIQSWDQKVRCEKIWGNSATKYLQEYCPVLAKRNCLAWSASTIFIPMQTPLPIKVGRRLSEADALPKWNPRTAFCLTKPWRSFAQIHLSIIIHHPHIPSSNPPSVMNLFGLLLHRFYPRQVSSWND